MPSMPSRTSESFKTAELVVALAPADLAVTTRDRTAPFAPRADCHPELELLSFPLDAAEIVAM